MIQSIVDLCTLKEVKAVTKNSILLPLIVLAVLLEIIAGCENETVGIKLDEYGRSGGRLQNIKTAAVLGFAGDNRGCGEDMALILSEHLRLLGYVTVRDPQQVREILGEKRISPPGEMDRSTASSIARALQVDALIYGRADAYFYSELKYRQDPYNSDNSGYGGTYFPRGRRRFNPYRDLYPAPYLMRRGQVTMEIRLYDAVMDKEAARFNLSRSYDHEYEHDDFSYFQTNPYGPFWFDRLKRIPMPSSQEMILILTDELLGSMFRQFVPYYVAELRTVQPDTTGSDLALQGRWSEAGQRWEKNPSPDWKICTNLGIYYERQMNPLKALSCYEKALELNPGSEMLREYVRQARMAADAMRPLESLDVPEGLLKYKVADVKDDGRIYINAGEEHGVKPGERFVITRYHVDFDRDLVTPRGGYYYRVCTLDIEKVFPGVSQGRPVDRLPSLPPRSGDPVYREAESAR